MHYFLKFIFGIKLYMFRTVPLSIIGSFSQYTQQLCMSYRFADSLQAGSGRNCSSVLILLASCMTYTIPVCTVQNSWWWTEELSETCRVLSQKLVHLVGFIIRMVKMFVYVLTHYFLTTRSSNTVHCTTPHSPTLLWGAAAVVLCVAQKRGHHVNLTGFSVHLLYVMNMIQYEHEAHTKKCYVCNGIVIEGYSGS